MTATATTSATTLAGAVAAGSGTDSGADGRGDAVSETTLVRIGTAGPGTGRRGLRIPRGLERFVGVVILFGSWELASRAGWISPRVLAAPSTVLTTGVDLARDGTLGAAVWASLQRVLWGLGLGIPVGAALAVAAGLWRAADDLIDANIQMLRFVPIIGLESLFILWVGIGETAKVSLIVLGVAFPVYVNTYSAIRARDPRWDELASVVGLGPRARLRRIVAPAAVPGFLVGVRMATGVAWLLLVFAEQLNASSGLGYLMVRAQTFFQSDVIVVCLVAYSAFGLLSDALARTLERRALSWQPGR